MANKYVAVHQFDGNVKLLKINLATCDRTIIPHDEVNPERLSFGVFEVENVEPDVESVALLATPEGPLLILKNIQFRPDCQNTKIKVTDDGPISHFLVLDKEEPVFGMFYKGKFGIGLHPYLNGRDDFDFYYWLSKNINNPRLYQTYTKEIKYISSAD